MKKILVILLVIIIAIIGFFMVNKSKQSVKEPIATVSEIVEETTEEEG